MSTPPPPSPTASASASVPASPVSTKKAQPLPWTHEETVQMIRAYQEKWYKLRRGPLKSSQWEEVAVTVAARCGYEHAEQSKTATQCRHKMEKLRQRHRTLKKRLRPGSRSRWPFFELMESLERGPMPISSRPMAVMPCQPEEEEEEEEQRHDRHGVDVDGEDDDEENSSKVRSIDYILRRPTIVNRFSGGQASFWQDTAAAKRSRDAVDGGGGYNGYVVEPPQMGGEMAVELADEIRAFAKRFIGVENTRMEFMKETERRRLEMEKRRIDMILQSQQKIVDSIDKAFGSSTNNCPSQLS
ncbi:hypothetical protein PRUPE_8G201900 [Prunus persica]|uniref:Myb-like domain-containing protein n=1 Tax=Prunus persica TaxID=3760 RepID=A0A251N0M0_PRUPE|nr:trihelix transcription factor ASIL1 [Prunus persica]ONH92891.1 hypothetical protein PRUPE_8G201900 [Prunus persica]